MSVQRRSFGDAWSRFRYRPVALLVTQQCQKRECGYIRAYVAEHFRILQAVREAAQYAPERRTLQPTSSPYTPYACNAQLTLCHEYS